MPGSRPAARCTIATSLFGKWLAPGACALWLLLVTVPAAAFERVLDRVDVAGGRITIQFNCQMAYVSHTPLRTGDELRVELQPLPGCATSSFSETLPVASAADLVREVRLELGVGARRALILRFSHSVQYVVRPLPGLSGIEVLLAVRSGGVTAEPSQPSATASRAPTRSLPAQAELDRLDKEAMEAMRQHDYDTAIRLYTKLLEYPEHSSRARAQEYLGLARERKGQFAQAKLEYQEYLRRYPDGADVVEVSQRLAALVTLEGRSTPSRRDVDARWQWQAAVSQEYRHDQNTVTESGATSPGIGSSSLYSDADLALRRRGERYDFAARADVTYLDDLQNSGTGSSGSTVVSAAYAELGNAGHTLFGRVGRQSATAGGVYGTFDGAYLSWRASPLLRFDVSAGRPLQVYSTQINGDRVFASSAVEFLGVRPGLDLVVFGLEQQASGYLDARQIGGELRYYHTGQSLVGQLDYDLSYHTLNAATLLGTLNLSERWIATGVLDRRKAPFVSTYNALIGQPTNSLSALVAQYGEAGVRQLALDRSADSDTVTVGLQHPLGERAQWWGNISYDKLGSTPASGGVAAVPSLGGMIIYSMQLLGGGWLFDADTNVVGISFGNGADTRNVSAFASARYAIAPHFRVGPRLTFDDTRSTAPASTGVTNGVTLSPALLLDWELKHGSVLLETGYDSTNQTLLNGGTPNTTTPPPGSTPGQVPPGTEIPASTRRFWLSLGYHLSF